MYINLLQNKHHYMGFCFVIISTNGMTQLFCTHMRCVCMYVIIIHLWAWTKVKNYSVPPPLPFLVCLLCFCFIAFSLFSLCSLLLVLSSTFSTNSSQFTRVSPPMITLLSRGTRLLERADATQQSFALAARLT